MEDTNTYVLQLTDAVTARKCALRIEPGDAVKPLKHLLDTFVKNPPVARLLSERRMTQESEETLSSLQELIYATSESGQLQDVFPGILFRQAERTVPLDAVPGARPALVDGVPIRVIDLVIDRLNAGYDRNWSAFHKRRWMKRGELYSSFVQSCLEKACGPKEAQTILQLATLKDKLKLVRIIARRIWESDFESYSRFTGRKLVYKSGDETIRNIMEGAGGICSEKVQALKFITDHFGLASEYLLAGVNARAPIAETKLRELLTTFDFTYSERYVRYWQHTALLYTIDDSMVLVDATNGNIPFLFLRDAAAERVLRNVEKQPIPVKMVEAEEDFYYHRVSQDIPQNLFFALEGWIPHADLIQVFENELGLYLSNRYFVTPIVFRNDKTFHSLKAEYARVCERGGLEYEVDREWTLNSPLGQQLLEQEPHAGANILAARDHLLDRYDDWEGPGHQAGLVVIKLANGPARPRVSQVGLTS